MFKRWQEFHSRSSRSRVHVTTLPRCTKIEALHFEGRRVFWYHLDVLEVQGPRDDATACVCRSMRSRDARGPSKGKLIRKTDESDNGLRQATLKEQKRNVTTSTTLALSELTCSKARTFVIFILFVFFSFIWMQVECCSIGCLFSTHQDIFGIIMRRYPFFTYFGNQNN